MAVTGLLALSRRGCSSDPAGAFGNMGRLCMRIVPSFYEAAVQAPPEVLGNSEPEREAKITADVHKRPEGLQLGLWSILEYRSGCVFYTADPAYTRYLALLLHLLLHICITLHDTTMPHTAFSSLVAPLGPPVPEA